MPMPPVKWSKMTAVCMHAVFPLAHTDRLRVLASHLDQPPQQRQRGQLYSPRTAHHELPAMGLSRGANSSTATNHEFVPSSASKITATAGASWISLLPVRTAWVSRNDLAFC